MEQSILKIKVLTSHYERENNHFTWGEGYIEDTIVEDAKMCLLPPDAQLTLKEALIILEYMAWSDEPKYGTPRWRFSKDDSVRIAKELGEERWKGGDYEECTIDAVKVAQKVVEEAKSQYQLFFPALGGCHLPCDKLLDDLQRIYNNIKIFYSHYTEYLTDEQLDNDINFTTINYPYLRNIVDGLINNSLRNLLAPALDECQKNIATLREPITTHIKNEALGKLIFDHYGIRSFFEKFESNPVWQSFPQAECDKFVFRALMPPLDIAMYFQDAEWIMKLLKRGAHKTIFRDLTLEYIESCYNIYKESDYTNEEIYAKIEENFNLAHVRKKVERHYWGIV